MAKTDLGKAWEDVFKTTWKKCFPNTFVFRLKDLLNGYKDTSQNPCDFLCFPGHNKLFMVECKEHKKASIPFSSIPQYERLLEYKNTNNVYPGILVWLSEKDIVFWVPILEMEKMVKDGCKSVGISAINDKKYNIVVLPAEKKRVYMDVDFTYLLKINQNGEVLDE